jgi:hypothetical protein
MAMAMGSREWAVIGSEDGNGRWDGMGMGNA